MPVLFMNTEETERWGLIYWALLTDVQIEGRVTTYRFEEMQPIRPMKPLGVLTKLDGERVSDSFQRSYVNCHTPEFLLESVDDPSTVTAIERPTSSSRADSVHAAATPFVGRPAIVRMTPPDRRRPETTIVEVRSQYEMCQREGELVRDFGEYLEALGLEWFVLELAVEDTKLQTDIYVPSRRQLIEAKAAATREMIRMAIGQIADYALQIANASDALDVRDRAVLLPRRPSLSLEELLDSEGIGAVWRTDDGAFEDNREGLFTS